MSSVGGTLNITNIVAVLKDNSSGTPLAGKSVSLSYILQGAPSGTAPTIVGTQTTDSTGTASFPSFQITQVQPGQVYLISAQFAGDSSYQGSTSNVIQASLLVSSNLSLSLTVSQTLS